MSQSNKSEITIYTTSWCGFCRSEKQYFDSKNIAYIAKDVEKDLEAQKELMDKIGGNFRGVPVTDIGGEIILGFDRPKIDAALEKHKLV